MKKNKENQTLGELIELSFRLNSLFLKIGDKIAEPQQQSSARWQVMGAILDEPSTVAKIARRMGITRQSVQRTANLLASEGLVKFSNNEDHKKSRLLYLSSSGREKMNLILKSQLKWGNKVGKKIGEDSLVSVVAELKRIEKLLYQDTYLKE